MPRKLPRSVLAKITPKRWNTDTTDPCPNCRRAGKPYSADCLTCNVFNRIAELTISRIFKPEDLTG